MSRSRLQSRWRKLRRDPAGFADDLPAAPLRTLALGGLYLLTWAQALAGRGGRPAWLEPDPEDRVGGWRLVDGKDLPPRLEVRADAGRMVVAAFSADGGLLAACEAGPGRPGLMALGQTPARWSAYRIGEGGPDRIELRPTVRLDQVARAREEGVGLAEALRRAWPPAERRPSEPSRAAYRAWIARNEPGPSDQPAIRKAVAALPQRPKISILTPVHDPRPAHLQAAIGSVLAQAYDEWELCLADDASASPEVRAVLDGLTDPRIRKVRLDPGRGVAGATNAALGLATGEIVLFLDHDDLLAPHALAMVAAAFVRDPGLQAVYSDEDSIDDRGVRSAPLFKPDFDGERLLAQNYVNHAFALRTALLRRLGGLRPGLDAAQDHDLVLRVAETAPGRIGHMPAVLYHWRVYPGAGTLSQREAGAAAPRLQAVRDALARRGEAADASIGGGGYAVVERRLPRARPKVLAIVPTRDRPDLLEACVTGLLERTRGVDLAVRIVDNGSETAAARETLARLAQRPGVEVLSRPGPFNFSALNNAAARGAGAELLALVNDDILVVEPEWLERMAALALRPQVGAVGARLHYPDGRLQHAGLVLGLGPQGVAGHPFRGQPADTPGPQRRLLVAQEASAVTAACLVVAREKFEAVGGLDESLAVAFNDVDFCLRLRQRGWRNLWTPHARLIHLESATRGPDADPARAARFQDEAERMKARWGALLTADPCYNPNLTLEDEGFTLARTSRRPAMDILAGR